jgi:hypothetical protein
VATEPQPLDMNLIRRKRAGDVEPEPGPAPVESDAPSMKMKPREVVQLTAVHVRIPEQIARGLRLMSVLENVQAQVLVAEALEDRLNRWNPAWRDSVPPKA